MVKHKVVIVGGGFGGVKTALALADDNRFHVTLISDNTDFRIYGTLYRVATGGTKQLASIPLTEIFEDKKINLLHDSMVNLDRDNRIVKTKVGHSISYDALILSVGVKTNYFHIQGLEEYSYGIKTPADAEELKQHLHQQLLDEKRMDFSYVVVGGGPTGVELAGALPAYIRKITQQHGLPTRKVHVDLIEAAPRLLPRSPKDISKNVAKHLRRLGIKVHLKTAVQAQTADALMVNNKPIRSHTVIWTAGVANNPLLSDIGLQLARNGKVRVDQFLQTEPGVYVIGDNADTPYAGMAQTALHDGVYVANNLQRLAGGLDPKPYHAKKPIYVFPAGPGFAAVLWGPLRIYGRLGWLLRRAADLIAYRDYEPWLSATKRWLKEDDDEESCLICAHDLAQKNT